MFIGDIFFCGIEEDFSLVLFMYEWVIFFSIFFILEWNNWFVFFFLFFKRKVFWNWIVEMKKLYLVNDSEEFFWEDDGGVDLYNVINLWFWFLLGIGWFLVGFWLKLNRVDGNFFFYVYLIYVMLLLYWILIDILEVW